MKLIEALEILRKTPPNAEQGFHVSLVCGFTPLHLRTMLAARLQLLYPDRHIHVRTGLYGDLLGSLQKIGESAPDFGVVILEWQDLDPRLGIRSVGSWLPDALPDIIDNVKARCGLVLRVLEDASKELSLIVCFPTLPLPPISHTPPGQASSLDAELRACVASLAAQVVQLPRIRVVNSQQLELLSPLGQRLDVQSEILTGFPYRLSHVTTLAELIGDLARHSTPKKGLITDLDDTLWNGILGEVGPEGVSWDLDQRSHMHGLYQSLLQALSAEGALISVASKNDRKLVEEVFSKRQPILPRTALFPIEVHWGPKSESIARILKDWNISADSAVFVDDSPMELAEVKAVFPEIECIRFPQKDPQAIYELLRLLRELFGKSELREEDAIRTESLRRAKSMRKSGMLSDATPETFLEHAEAELTVSFNKETPDPRALELINKTNQFNLNGKRYTETSWQSYLRNPNTFLMLVAYKDKYGPLGKIAVLAGRLLQEKLCIDTWVMSCRAFSRRIEHRCLQELFARFDADDLEFDFVSTPRNEPIRIFLVEILGINPEPQSRLSRHDFFERRKDTFHRVREINNG